MTCSRATSPGSHPISPRVHNTACPSRRVTLLPKRRGGPSSPGKVSRMQGPRELGRPRPFLPPLIADLLDPVLGPLFDTFSPWKCPSRLVAPLWFAPIGLIAQHSHKPARRSRPSARCRNREEARFPSDCLAQNRPFALRPIAQFLFAQASSPDLERREVASLRKHVGRGGSRELSFALRPAHPPLSPELNLLNP
jgi:hypothetical protein